MDKVGEVVQQLADQLGVTVEYLWPLLVRRAFIGGVLECVLLLAVVVTETCFARWLYRKCSAGIAKGDRSEEGYRVAQIVTVVVSVFVWIIAMPFAHEGLLAALAPEGAALENLIKLATR